MRSVSWLMASSTLSRASPGSPWITLCVRWRQSASEYLFFFFFQAEDGIRDLTVTGVRRVLFRSRVHQRRIPVRRPRPDGDRGRLGRLARGVLEPDGPADATPARLGRGAAGETEVIVPSMRRNICIWLALGFAALAMPSCRPRGAPPPADAGAGTPPRFTPPGRCFGKPMKCAADSQCAPPFSTCQEGTCCSGAIDPVTCACTCAGGPACGPNELCCAGGEWSAPEDRRVLKCRPRRDCY